VPPTADAAETAALERIENQRVLAAIRVLPRRQCEVLLLRFQADLSEIEIAETLGISTGAVKTHASRGLAAVRNRLQEST
jgi:RNA polymerase sigma factor (sigma-70 family)